MNEEIKTNTKHNSDSAVRRFFKALGPGFVTGAADDDPSGIVTYTQTGARFGYGQLWMVVFMLPMMIAIQEMCGRIGIVTGKGISKVLKDHYSKPVLYIIVGLLLVANTINLGADLGAMAAVTQLFFDGPVVAYAFFFFLLSMYLAVFVPYHRSAKVLKWLTISLFGYFLTGLIVANDWSKILHATFIPSIRMDRDFFLLLVAMLGTTISPYLFFWQTAQEVEEKNEKFALTHKMPRVTKAYIASMRTDTFFGMLFSEIAAWFIIVTAAVVLHGNGINDVESASQAAQALQPLVQGFPHAGTIAKVLFSVGIIGGGLLAVPIFAASSSYAVSEILDWNEGLEKRFNQAKGFYGVLLAGGAVGLLMNFLHINPIKALVYTAVINGFVSVPIIFMILRISNNEKVMGHHTNGTWSNFFGWFTFLTVTSAALLSIYFFLS
jgi:NRAMP (natural resistance-associated macrophage protein)-like metal ion transporter